MEIVTGKKTNTTDHELDQQSAECIGGSADDIVLEQPREVVRKGFF